MNLAATIVRDPCPTPTQTFYEDPLDDDEASDVAVIATRRRLTRLALIAAETGARFQREGLECDPMAWLLAPRRLFDGLNAIEACLDRTPCVRALVLHGLSIGMEAEANDLDELIGGSESEGDGASAPYDTTTFVEVMSFPAVVDVFEHANTAPPAPPVLGLDLKGKRRFAT